MDRAKKLKLLREKFEHFVQIRLGSFWLEYLKSSKDFPKLNDFFMLMSSKVQEQQVDIIFYNDLAAVLTFFFEEQFKNCSFIDFGSERKYWFDIFFLSQKEYINTWKRIRIWPFKNYEEEFKKVIWKYNRWVSQVKHCGVSYLPGECLK